MVDDDGGRQRREEVPQLGQVLRFEIHDDVPAKRRDPVRDLEEDLARRKVDQPAYEVETSAADTGFVHGGRHGAMPGPYFRHRRCRGGIACRRRGLLVAKIRRCDRRTPQADDEPRDVNARGERKAMADTAEFLGPLLHAPAESLDVR